MSCQLQYDMTCVSAFSGSISFLQAPESALWWLNGALNKVCQNSEPAPRARGHREDDKWVLEHTKHKRFNLGLVPSACTKEHSGHGEKTCKVIHKEITPKETCQRRRELQLREKGSWLKVARDFSNQTLSSSQNDIINQKATPSRLVFLHHLSRALRQYFILILEMMLFPSRLLTVGDCGVSEILSTPWPCESLRMVRFRLIPAFALRRSTAKSSWSRLSKSKHAGNSIQHRAPQQYPSPGLPRFRPISPSAQFHRKPVIKIVYVVWNFSRAADDKNTS